MVIDSDHNEAEQGIKIGFLTVRHLEDGSYRAGLLVTDEKGKPLELRATGALRPDRIQALIYGDTLVPTIAEELCGQPLIDNLREQPDVIVADHEAFLPLHTDDRPVVYIRRTGQEPEVDVGSNVDPQERRSEEVLRPVEARFEPVVLEFARGIEDEARQLLRSKFARLFEAFDLVEPFDRVTKALDMLHEQQSKKGE